MDANTHYTNEYHDDIVKNANELEDKLDRAATIVDNGSTPEELEEVRLDPMTAKSVSMALKAKDLCEVGRLFRAAAIEYVVTTL